MDELIIIKSVISVMGIWCIFMSFKFASIEHFYMATFCNLLGLGCLYICLN